jgi:hypothetical protein
MSFTAKVEKTPTAVAAAAAVSQSTQGRRPQGSTTQRMLARLPDVRSELEREGNIASQVTERWICKQKDCKQYGHVCWWGVRDNFEYHLQVQGTHLQVWCSGIERGDLTAGDPGPSLIQQITRHHARRTAGVGAAKASLVAVTPSTPASTHFSFTFNGVGSSGGIIKHAADPSADSSPVRLPLTQSSAVDLREVFLDWCKKDHSRSKELLEAEDAQTPSDSNLSSAGTETGMHRHSVSPPRPPAGDED